jgi:hypothetical protein
MCKHPSLIAILCMIAISGVAWAIPASPHPFSATQPDGASITLYIRGDESYHWLEDQDGFTVLQQGTLYVYAISDGAGGLGPSTLQVGKDSPFTAGLARGLKPSLTVLNQTRNKAFDSLPPPLFQPSVPSRTLSF